MWGLILLPLERIINRYILLDPEVPQQLAKLADKCLHIHFDGVAIYVRITNKSLQLLPTYAEEATCSLQASPIELVRLLHLSRQGKLLFSDKITLTGDLDFLQKLSNIFIRLEIDWEEHISHLLGDIAAHRLGSDARSIHTWLNASCKTLKQDVGEYLQEEIRLLPPRLEINDFMHEVDTLRSDIDRLIARIARLHPNK